MIYARSLGQALQSVLSEDGRVVVLGEDIADPYGGAFKVTRGLTTEFPDRVRSTPVSEAAIAGVAAGLALAGHRPIIEIMFGDFLSLCFDQIVNHISKYEAMYNGSATCPVIVRTPSGGGRGYGPTHSQSLEKHFVGIPHLRVIAASLVHEPTTTFRVLLADERPALHVEHKLLYPLEMLGAGDLLGATVEMVEGGDRLPTAAIRHVPRAECRATIVAYGYQAEIARRVQARLAFEEEIFVELLVAAQLSPLDMNAIIDSAAVTGSLATVEEGTAGWSWGTEIAAEASRQLFHHLRQPVEVLASERDVIPSAREREREALVGEAQCERTIRQAAA